MKTKLSAIFAMGVGLGLNAGGALYLFSDSAVAQEAPLSVGNSSGGRYGNSSFEISPDDAEKLESLALDGSGKAALRLANYYYLVRRDDIEGLYWMRIAAENGDPYGMYNLAFHLRLSQNAHDKARARYWLKRVQIVGNAQIRAFAQSLLQEMNRSR
jgi:TPR repeat protein